MKYSREKFDAVIECFDMTVKIARSCGLSTFDCIPLYDSFANACFEPCKSYCPLYENGINRKCSADHDAAYWQFAKEKFIIENEPED